METRKRAILDALSKFMNQRSGIEFANYGDVKAFCAEQRSITKDLHHARTLLMAVSRTDGITADDLIKAAQGAYSGRLTIKCERTPAPPPKFARDDWTCGCGLDPKHPTAIHIDDCLHKPRDVATVDYCTGQYFPTEYRRAVCAVLASALWDYTRENAMPAVYGYRVESWSQLGKGREYGHVRASRADAETELANKGGREYGRVSDVYQLPKGCGTYASAGDWLRAHFRKEFGRGIASRWFT